MPGKPLARQLWGSDDSPERWRSNPLLGPDPQVPSPGRDPGSRSATSCHTLPAVADELCVLRSCHGDSVNHPQSVYQMNTGSILMGKTVDLAVG